MEWFFFCAIFTIEHTNKFQYTHDVSLVRYFILFAALQALVVASFIFIFQVLPSNKAENKPLIKFYRIIEWCEAIIFTIILPLPMFFFFYALIII